jgi:hypothetical protein
MTLDLAYYILIAAVGMWAVWKEAIQRKGLIK